MTIDRSTCTAEQHGTYSAYSWWGCRCSDAREAWRLRNKRYREGRAPDAFVDITGTARRLQALVALGYSWNDLGRRLNRSGRRLARLATCETDRIRVATADMVTALFEKLSATPAPQGFSAAKARNTALRNGYLPPLAWGDDIDDPTAVPNVTGDGRDFVDPVALHRVLAGQAPFSALSDAEKTALFRDHLHGWGYKRIRDAFGLHVYTVDTWRTRAGVTGQVAA